MAELDEYVIKDLKAQMEAKTNPQKLQRFDITNKVVAMWGIKFKIKDKNFKVIREVLHRELRDDNTYKIYLSKNELDYWTVHGWTNFTEFMNGFAHGLQF